jgi:hypothetical protein
MLSRGPTTTTLVNPPSPDSRSVSILPTNVELFVVHNAFRNDLAQPPNINATRVGFMGVCSVAGACVNGFKVLMSVIFRR